MTRILVTGGSGVLGRDVARRLLAAGNEVRVLSGRPGRADDPAAAELQRSAGGFFVLLKGSALTGGLAVATTIRPPREPAMNARIERL